VKSRVVPVLMVFATICRQPADEKVTLLRDHSGVCEWQNDWPRGLLPWMRLRTGPFHTLALGAGEFIPQRRFRTHCKDAAVNTIVHLAREVKTDLPRCRNIDEACRDQVVLEDGQEFEGCQVAPKALRARFLQDAIFSRFHHLLNLFRLGVHRQVVPQDPVQRRSKSVAPVCLTAEKEADIVHAEALGSEPALIKIFCPANEALQPLNVIRAACGA